MAISQYLSQLPLFMDGIAIEEATSTEATLRTNAQKVVTIAKGLSGKSSGAPEVQITGRFAVQVGGLEYNFWKAAFKGQYVDAQLGVGTGDYAQTGWFEEVSFSAATDKAVEGSYTWVGPAGDIE